MAGAVRQPIDEKALAKYIDDNVPVIKTPIDLKQVRLRLASIVHEQEEEKTHS